VALYEVLLLVVLHRIAQRVDDPWVGPAFCVGFGLVRILVEPFRALPPLGEPVLAPAAVALVWLLFGGVWARASLCRVAPAALGCLALAARDRMTPRGGPPLRR
jgi:prolipoprotein diacylglyceryltransferase